MISAEPWLDPIPAALRDDALAALDAGDASRFLGTASNEHSLELVWRNVALLRERGVYEPALLDAFTATRTNNHRCPLRDLRLLFDLADRARLRAAGDPLPGPGPFSVYRGVSGRGATRRVRGFSWTASLERASWFANRYRGLSLPDPAVFRVTVRDEDVLAYTNGRLEQEFLVLLPSRVRPVRVAAQLKLERKAVRPCSND
jgi:hypothetical protein